MCGTVNMRGCESVCVCTPVYLRGCAIFLKWSSQVLAETACERACVCVCVGVCVIMGVFAVRVRACVCMYVLYGV